MDINRVAVFVDGFNLYHGVRELHRPHLKWLDLRLLASKMIRRKSQSIVGIYYFSAMADHDPARAARHREYINALQVCEVTPVLGKFKDKDKRFRCCMGCPHPHYETTKEEKETDVNIALAMLNMAYKRLYDSAILISADSDLAPVIRLLRTEFPKLSITVAAPPCRGSKVLEAEATEYRKISSRLIARCLLAEKIVDPGGNVVATRPSDYDPPPDVSVPALAASSASAS
jgi:uncharacterized LabA/DUF88 family protein